jgi:hypothetical protein
VRKHTRHSEFRTHFRVQSLQSVGLDRWFDVGPRPVDRDAALARLESRMTADEKRRPFRVVATDPEGCVRGRIAGFISSEGCLALWPVYHSENQSIASKRELTRLLVRHCVSVATEDHGVRYLEANTPHDTPGHAIFIGCLASDGFREICRRHVYTIIASQGLSATSPPSGVTRLPYEKLGRGQLAALLSAVHADTRDRLQQSHIKNGHVFDELWRQVASSGGRAYWTIATQGEMPVGHVCCNLSGFGGNPTEGWVMEIGVVPQSRRSYVGDWLLRDAIRQMHEMGASSVSSLIDVENIPSQRLHTAVGFAETPLFNSVWRMNVNER